MRKNKRIYKISASILGLLSAFGVSTAVISCRSTSTSSGEFSTNYVYEFVADPYGGRKTDDKIVAWLPWEIKAPTITDGKEVPGNYAYVTAQWLKEIFPNIDIHDIKTNSLISYDGASGVVDTYVRAGNTEQIPDIVINYPDIAATLERYKLLQSFGDVSGIITPALESEARLVFSDTGANLTLPFAKSTDLAYFDVPLFAKILSDISKLKNNDAKLVVPTNSAQHRMIKMILSTQYPYVDIYKNDTTQTTEFLWSALNTSWATKTAIGGIWEKDRVKIDSNYPLNSNRKDNLFQIDFSKKIFTSYDEIKNLISILRQAYDIKTTDAKATSAYFLAIESATNEVYAYQYDKSGHEENNFFMAPKSIKGYPSLNFNFGTGTSGSAFKDGYNWLRDVLNTGAAVLKGKELAIYPTDYLKDHRTLIGLSSSSGANYATEAAAKSDLANESDVYYDFQPTKASLTETKQTIINQGPGIIVTKIHGDAKALEIATKLKEHFSQSGAKIVNNKDTGYWTSAGYLYGNANSYVIPDFTNYLENSIKTSSGWKYNISKYLLSGYYNSARMFPEEFDLFASPTSPKTQSIRKFIDTYTNGAFAKFPSETLPTAASLITELIKTAISDKAFREE